jgi:hypothetical protein
VDSETIATLVAAASTLFIMLLLYGVWVYLDHLAARDERPWPRARPPQDLEAEERPMTPE